VDTNIFDFNGKCGEITRRVSGNGLARWELEYRQKEKKKVSRQARVYTAILQSARISKRRLGDSVVLGEEVENHLVTDLSSL